MEAFTSETTEQKTIRRPRSAETRNFESRESTQRVPVTFARGSRFNLPQAVLDDERYEFSFIESTIANDEDYARCDNAMGNHWKPVAIDEYPELSRSYSSFRKREDDNNIFSTGGQKLFKRETEICEQEREFFDNKNQTSDDLVAAHREHNPMAHYFSDRIGAERQRGGRL